LVVYETLAERDDPPDEGYGWEPYSRVETLQDDVGGDLAVKGAVSF